MLWVLTYKLNTKKGSWWRSTLSLVKKRTQITKGLFHFVTSFFFCWPQKVRCNLKESLSPCFHFFVKNIFFVSKIIFYTPLSRLLANTCRELIYFLLLYLLTFFRVLHLMNHMFTTLLITLIQIQLKEAKNNRDIYLHLYRKFLKQMMGNKT